MLVILSDLSEKNKSYALVVLHQLFHQLFVLTDL